MDEYTLEEVAATYLTRPEGQSLLEYASTLSGDAASRVLLLRKKASAFDPAYAKLAAEIAVSRERAKRRGFADAERLFFTEDALAQATSPVLSEYRAQQLARFGIVADLCCGAGMDAIALAKAGARVIAVDIDPVRLLFAHANAEVCGVADKITFLNEPVENLGWTEANAAFFDPARRTDAGRVSKHGDRYAPPLDFLHTIRTYVRGGCAKLSPALPDDVLRDLSPSRVEFLSENRECKEACVWFGEADGFSRTGPDFTAILLGTQPILRLISSENRYESQSVPESGEGRYLLDPDPAIIRAGAFSPFFREEVKARFWSAEDNYLATDLLPDNHRRRMASVYCVLTTMPYAPKKVSPWLRENGYKRIVVKKRHFPQEPEAVARELGVSVRGDGKEITLVLVRESAKKFLAVLCEPVGLVASGQ